MNDLRSRNRSLSAVPDEISAPTSTPPRIRPETDESTGRRMSRRQSIIERARQIDEAEGTEVAVAGSNDHKFRSSRPRPEDQQVGVDEEDVTAAQDNSSGPEGPSSRPNRRRQVAEDAPDEEDRFPWHFQFDDDEPEELQASSPLLSRAFRATIG